MTKARLTLKLLMSLDEGAYIVKRAYAGRCIIHQPPTFEQVVVANLSGARDINQWTQLKYYNVAGKVVEIHDSAWDYAMSGQGDPGEVSEFVKTMRPANHNRYLAWHGFDGKGGC